MSLILLALATGGIDNIEILNSEAHYNLQIQDEKVTKESDVKDTQYELKPNAFNLYLDAEANTVKNKKRLIWINSDEDMDDFVNELYKELPYEVIVKSKRFDRLQLKKMYEESKNQLSEDITPEMHGLATYKVLNNSNSIRVIDISNKNYNAATIKKAYEAYTTDLAKYLKDEDELRSILNVYNYIFNNFKYNANGFQYMTVGNIGNGELACNGISYLTDTLLEKVGIKSKIRGGYSHYWNVATLSNGQEITVDITSDIVLEDYLETFGSSTQEHIKKTSTIAYFSAEYSTGKYHEVSGYKNDILLANNR